MLLRLTLAAACAGVLASAWNSPLVAQSTQPTTAPPPPESAPVAIQTKGSAAWQLLVGNTVVAASRAGGYTEFYGAEGVVKHLDRDGKSTGKWALQGEKICFDFPEEDDHSCVDVELNGSKGVFTDEDAAKDTFDLLPGNAKAL